MEILLFLILGLSVGSLSGLIGIGGGVLVTPALIFLFGFSQQQAQGTTLAMLVPPIGILGTWTYYQKGQVNVQAAGLLCLGFVLGGLLGAQLAVGLPDVLLRRIFGVAMVAVGARMLFF